jgi:arsenite methyltransferase
MAETNVKTLLGQLRDIFDVDAFLKQEVSPRTIRQYYTDCAWVYGLLHSPAGAIHLALNYDGRYSPDGFYEQPRLVQKQINVLRPQNVLELACGKGFNTHWLAPRNAQTEFCAIDWTPLHVRIASRKRRPNAMFAVGDYQRLAFADSAFDLVFAIECLCYARNLGEVLAEAYRVLRPGGRLMLTDGFRRPGFANLEPAQEIAAQLVELSMNVEQFWEIDTFVQTAESVGFHVHEQHDLSDAIQPNLRHFQRIAQLYLRWPSLARRLTRLLPPYLVRHAVTGLLGAETLRSQAQGYYALVLEKPQKEIDQ